MTTLEEMSALKPYRYIAYWGVWRRACGYIERPEVNYQKPDGSGFLIKARKELVEVALTPINPSFETSWIEMGFKLFVGSSLYKDSNNDRICRYLPPHVEKYMRLNLKSEQVDMLLNYDFSAHIDIAQYDRVVNGGAQFQDCCIQMAGQWKKKVATPEDWGVYNIYDPHPTTW